MHVRRVALVSTLAGVVALSPLACDAPAAKKGEAKPLALDATAASTAPENEALLQAARRTRDAAAALAAKCVIVDGTSEFSISFYDACVWSAGEESALTTSAVALRDLANGDAGPRLRGPAAMFVDQVRLFAEWVELVHDLPKRGALAHYQELAGAWNAWRPTEPVAPDPIPVRYPSWMHIDAGPDGSPLGWQRCAEGPCIVKTISP